MESNGFNFHSMDRKNIMEVNKILFDYIILQNIFLCVSQKK